jgi:hypothetical protein
MQNDAEQKSSGVYIHCLGKIELYDQRVLIVDFVGRETIQLGIFPEIDERFTRQLSRKHFGDRKCFFVVW